MYVCTMMKALYRIILLLASLLPGICARAQDTGSIQGIPTGIYYLMPSFSDGTILFDGMAPAQGKLNICAVDNTLRFLDKDGKELAASDESQILRVRIDTVTFLRSQGVYFRLFPVTGDAGVALRRDVRIDRDLKQGAFGTSSQTSAIREYDIIYADGVSYRIDSNKEYPFHVSETLCLYHGNRVLALSKKSFKKLFPARKADIDAWFAAGNPLPGTLQEVMELMRRWAQ